MRTGVGVDDDDSDGQQAARETLVAAAGVLGRSGVLSHSGHGNFSARLDDDRILLSARGVRDLDADGLAVVGLDGVVSQGELAPSAREIVSMHVAAYTTRPDIGAVVHTHSPHATAFALAHQPIGCRYEALLRHGQDGDVPVVAWGPRGSDASVQGIVDALSGHPGTTAVLLANHGILAFGPTAHAAVMVAIILEEAARLELDAAAIGGTKAFPASAADEVRRSMARARR